MYTDVLPLHGRKCLDRLQALKAPALSGWTLAGGTGLAFHLRHRRSVDLDFFRTTPFRAEDLHAAFRTGGAYETLQEARDTLTVLLWRTKLSFFRVSAPMLFPAVPERFFAVADLRDIALMKLVALGGRGARKDFIDLYFILQQGVTLPDLFAWLPRKYGRGRANVYHLLKSLTWFADAETEPMPRMLKPCTWSECKAFFLRQAHDLVLA